MKTLDPEQQPNAWGMFEDADALPRWSFDRLTPGQRLAWLTAAVELAHQSGALRPRRPDESSLAPRLTPRCGVVRRSPAMQRRLAAPITYVIQPLMRIDADARRRLAA